MEEWKTYRLEDLTIDGKGHYGIGAPAVDYDENKFTYLRITDINDDGSLNYSGLKSVDDPEASKYLLQEGDIVFARTGNSTGRSYYYEPSDGQFVFAGFLIKFSLDPTKVNPRFLKYYTHSKMYYEWVQSFDTGATRGNINAQTFGSMEINLPPREVQDRLVEILRSIDDKIKLNNRINHNLEEQAQALYKSWFVDFEPFKGGEFVRSELGMIPKDWEVLRFNEFATLSNERVNSESIPEFSVTNNGIFPRDAKFNKQLSSSSLKNKIVRKGDLVFGMSREILNWGVMDDLVGGVSSAYTIYRVNSSMMDGLYLKNFMNQHLSYFKDLIRPAAREGQSIDKGVLATKIVYRPSDIIWSSFLSIYLRMIDQEKLLRDETQKLIAFRDTILPELMEGRISISETC